MEKSYTSLDIKDLQKFLAGCENKTNILSGLGIVGWENYERAIQSFLFLGGSILLVGNHGLAKSMLARKIGDALGVNTASYDASKSLWEDIVGFPDPAKLMDITKRGNVVGLPRIETPTSIWSKHLILVDEVNRCSPETQSKWLEVILNQTLMGEPTSVKWVISAMNQGYAGTFPLDLAFVNRYLFFIPAPVGVRMPKEKLDKILGFVNPDETPAVMTWANRLVDTENPKMPIVVSDDYISTTEKQNEEFIKSSGILKASLAVAAYYYEGVKDKYSKSVEDYIISVTKTLCNEAKPPFETDPRRMRMIKNAILAATCLEVPMQDGNSPSVSTFTIQDLALQILYLSYPTVAGIDGPTRDHLDLAHRKSLDLLEDRDSPVYFISIEANPIKKLELLFGYSERDNPLVYKVLTDVLNIKDGYTSRAISYALLGAIREGLHVDTKSLSILLESIKKTSGISIIKELPTLNDMKSVSKIFSFLAKDTFAESAAAHITLEAVAQTDKSFNDAMLASLEKLYPVILDTLNEYYYKLVALVPNSNMEVFLEDLEEDWEKAIAEEEELV